MVLKRLYYTFRGVKFYSQHSLRHLTKACNLNSKRSDPHGLGVHTTTSGQ